MQIDTVTVGRWRTNCYLVHDGQTGIVIDPGDDAKQVIERIDAIPFTPLAIVNTHGHFDHVGGVFELRERYHAPFYLHSSDKRLLSHANLYRALAGDATVYATPPIDACLDDLASISLGPWQIDVLPTPGHTPGSVCLIVGQAIFSGDTLFHDKAGNANVPGGSAVALEGSLTALRRQPRAARLYPGHGVAGELGKALDAAAVAFA